MTESPPKDRTWGQSDCLKAINAIEEQKEEIGVIKVTEEFMREHRMQEYIDRLNDENADLKERLP